MRLLTPHQFGPDAGKVAEGGNDAAGLKLREEAGREPGMLTELDQAHGLFETQALDALSDMFFRDELLGGFGINLGHAPHIFVANQYVIAHSKLFAFHRLDAISAPYVVLINNHFGPAKFIL